MRTWMSCAVLATLAVQAFAQEERNAFDQSRNRAGTQAASYEMPAFPFEGEIAVERLNVRMFPKSDQTGIIAAIVGLGEKVTVVGEREDYFQILPTRGCTAWIFGRSVQRDGAAGTVTSIEAPVRMDSRVNADVLCTLKQGDKVNVLSEYMGWFKIEAPPAIRYFVARKYVRPGKALDIALPDEKAARKETAREPKTAADLSRLPAAEKLLEEQRRLIEAGRLDEVDFSGVVGAYEQAAADAKDASVKAEAERLYGRYRELHLVWTTLKAKKAEDEARLAKLKEAMQPKAPEKKEWTMTGYVDTTGSTLFKRPGTHKLVMGGKIVAFLRVKDGDEAMFGRLNDHYERYVGVNGVVIKDPEGWPGYSVVVVDEIVTLTK